MTLTNFLTTVIFTLGTLLYMYTTCKGKTYKRNNRNKKVIVTYEYFIKIYPIFKVKCGVYNALFHL